MILKYVLTKVRNKTRVYIGDVFEKWGRLLSVKRKHSQQTINCSCWIWRPNWQPLPRGGVGIPRSNVFSTWFQEQLWPQIAPLNDLDLKCIQSYFLCTCSASSQASQTRKWLCSFKSSNGSDQCFLCSWNFDALPAWCLRSVRCFLLLLNPEFVLAPWRPWTEEETIESSSAQEVWNVWSLPPFRPPGLILRRHHISPSDTLIWVISRGAEGRAFWRGTSMRKTGEQFNRTLMAIKMSTRWVAMVMSD